MPSQTLASNDLYETIAKVRAADVHTPTATVHRRNQPTDQDYEKYDHYQSSNN
jgi:hypothetical protein